MIFKFYKISSQCTGEPRRKLLSSNKAKFLGEPGVRIQMHVALRVPPKLQESERLLVGCTYIFSLFS